MGRPSAPPAPLAPHAALLGRRLFRGPARSISYDDPEALRLPHVHIVRLRCPDAQSQRTTHSTLLDPVQPLFKAVDIVDVRQGGLGPRVTAALSAHFPSLLPRCESDAQRIGSVFESALGCSTVEVKAEVLRGSPCTRFHADHVALRALCTYLGPRGTEYVPSEACYFSGGALVDVVEGEAQGATLGEWVLLKGRLWGGCEHGAVHRSPLVDLSALRLVLTIDACSGCG